MGDVGDNQILPQIQIEMKNRTCLRRDKFKNANFVICTIVSNHLPLMGYNTCLSFIEMVP
jgi:hypothetical protein